MNYNEVNKLEGIIKEWFPSYIKRSIINLPEPSIIEEGATDPTHQAEYKDYIIPAGFRYRYKK